MVQKSDFKSQGARSLDSFTEMVPAPIYFAKITIAIVQ